MIAVALGSSSAEVAASVLDPQAIPGSTWALKPFCLCPLEPGACRCPDDGARWE